MNMFRQVLYLSISMDSASPVNIVGMPFDFSLSDSRKRFVCILYSTIHSSKVSSHSPLNLCRPANDFDRPYSPVRLPNEI